MNKYINQFIEQINTAVEIGEKAMITPSDFPIQNILVSGLGGSGIGGSLVTTLLADTLCIPMGVNKDYFIPEYVNQHTLLIISSYSGNTEETIYALERGIEKGAKIVCVTTQEGEIASIAREKNIDLIVIPSGMPPRVCLTLSFPQLFFILNQLGLISQLKIDQIKDTVPFLKAEDQSIREEAKKVANQLGDKLPIIYATNKIAPVAVRFRQQLNENSKMLAWHHILPEMNHNELVGWTTENQNLAAVFLRNQDDYNRNQRRIEITKKVVSKYTDTILSIWSKGANIVEQSLYLIYLTDWVSYYLSEARGVDAVEVKIIDYLKSEMAKLGE